MVPATKGGTALQQALAETARVLREAGIETPALDARLLLCHATGLTHETLIARGHEPVAPGEAARLADSVMRRLAGEPVSRIRGGREFYGRDFRIDVHALDPRPDTETLIDAALELIGRQHAQDRPLALLDLGTGSGAILLTLLAELPGAFGTGTDISIGALRRAAANARRMGLGARARFLVADWFEGVSGRFDLIVSNPPYIPSGEIEGLAPEVAAYDPRPALDGGADGLDAYRRIAAGALAHLRPGGHLLVEIGAGQAEAVMAVFRASGLLVGEDAIRLDLAGRPRAVLAESSGSRGYRTSQGRKNQLGKPRCSG